jgi:3-oxoacyl-[acyl-carrier-protein] synthase III
MQEVYITKIAKFLPNELVSNDEMEQYLGLINGKPSKSRRIVLRNNGIQGRYYAITKEGKSTHTNAQMVSLAIRKLFTEHPEDIKSVELLCCGTSTPDQLMPSHAVMVHGNLPESSSIEVVSPSGVCCSGMHAFKYAYLSVLSGDKQKVVCTGSERVSPLLKADTFDAEAEKIESLNNDPYIAFEKDFLRWMLSDGAGAFLLENKKSQSGISLKVEWVEAISYANVMESCMYMGAEKNEDGTLKGYIDHSPAEILDKSLLSIKQDVKLLSENIVKLGFTKLKDILAKRNFNVDDIAHFLPHISSYFFEDKIAKILDENEISIPKEKWFTNLRTKGNIGSGSIYIMCEELFNSGTLVKGEKILLAVPESSRFSYVFCLLTVA